MNRQNNQYLGAIIGHAVGDAMGFPTEFSKREELLKNPVIEMIDSTDIGQPAGSWSDDTAMEIATIDSFIQKKYFDYKDIMDKWVKWISKSEYTPTGVAFDIGRTCLKAIKKYCNGTAPLQCGSTSINENGNGSLMRILPVALYAYSKKLDDISIHKLTNEVSSLTHAHEVSRLGCYIYVQFIICLLKGNTKQEAYKHIQYLDYSAYDMHSLKLYKRILDEQIEVQRLDQIKSTGYIVDTLESAMWIFMNAEHYKEAIIASTNIGGDTDTIGAIVGSMAGIYYGFDSIPSNWLEKLQRKDYLIELVDRFEKSVAVLPKNVSKPIHRAKKS
ncbi:ADP-ribosylglycohydrolase family protein [uncultured Solobacterium sp.]|jgi:ADP-ribosylation/crystallin J1|uniref:ADP-ribosylglycohydrolase family protein n=1 Tax=uncultured Solobacterium sp. TaxID=747375 RepID=UPI001CAB0261|nr:ADP-ribosylglycohydrolase family protein [uncultured Solobacterium sp.]MBF1072650.1 ADP-ribosylglycohydrolase family protein [Solobacterium sp.]